MQAHTKDARSLDDLTIWAPPPVWRSRFDASNLACCGGAKQAFTLHHSFQMAG